MSCTALERGNAPSSPIRRAAGIVVAISLVVFGGCELPQWYHNKCKVGPNYVEPPIAVESQWIDYQHDRRLSEQPVDTSNWWGIFNDPKLNELVTVASQQNLTLREAGTRIIQAEAVRGIAYGNLFPQTQQAFGSYDRTQVSKTIANSPPVKQFDTWTNGFNLSWELDFWGRFRRALESADAALESTIAGYDNVLVILVSDVASTYVQIRTLQEELRLVKENVQLQSESWKIAEAQFNAGQADASDVLQTRNNVEQTEALIPPLEVALRQANNALCILLGIPPRDLVAEFGEGPIPTVPPNVAMGIPCDLVRRRPDVRQAERLVAAQCAQIGVAESELYPHFAINGVLQWQSEHVNDLFRPASSGGTVGPSFVWNILNYGRIQNSILQQQALFQQTVYSYQSTVLNAQREAEDSIVGFLKAQDQTAKLQLAVRDIKELDGVLLTQANAGATNFDRVFVVQSQATVQMDNLATSTGNIALNLIRIYRSLGGGWQIRCQAPCASIASVQPPVFAAPAMEESLPAPVAP